MDRKTDGNCFLYIQLGKRKMRRKGLCMQVTCKEEMKRERRVFEQLELRMWVPKFYQPFSPGFSKSVTVHYSEGLLF